MTELFLGFENNYNSYLWYLLLVIITKKKSLNEDIVSIFQNVNYGLVKNSFK